MTIQDILDDFDELEAADKESQTFEIAL